MASIGHLLYPFAKVPNWRNCMSAKITKIIGLNFNSDAFPIHEIPLLQASFEGSRICSLNNYNNLIELFYSANLSISFGCFLTLLTMVNVKDDLFFHFIFCPSFFQVTFEAYREQTGEVKGGGETRVN
jgi:hypothetical protein